MILATFKVNGLIVWQDICTALVIRPDGDIWYWNSVGWITNSFCRIGFGSLETEPVDR